MTCHRTMCATATKHANSFHLRESSLARSYRGVHNTITLLYCVCVWEGRVYIIYINSIIALYRIAVVKIYCTFENG